MNVLIMAQHVLSRPNYWIILNHLIRASLRRKNGDELGKNSFEED